MCVKIRMKFRNWRELNRDTVLSVICAPSSLFSSIHLHALFAETRWEIAAPLLRSCRPRHFLEQPLRWQERGRQSGRRGRRPGGRWRRRRRVRTRPVLRGGRGRAADRRHRAGTERAGCASRGRHLAERAPHPPHPPTPRTPRIPRTRRTRRIRRVRRSWPLTPDWRRRAWSRWSRSRAPRRPSLSKTIPTRVLPCHPRGMATRPSLRLFAAASASSRPRCADSPSSVSSAWWVNESTIMTRDFGIAFRSRNTQILFSLKQQWFSYVTIRLFF